MEPFDTIEEALAEIAAGRPIIVTDDEDRENEGDLVMAASTATPEWINFMIRQCGGLICLPTVEHRLKRLGLSQMVHENTESHRTAFTVSVDAAEGVTTGISAYDRCRAIRIIANPESRPEELVRPGHIFPLCAKPGGVLQRAGHTEAAVDFAVLAGHDPSGVICEILNEDGTMARLPQLVEFKRKHGLKLVSIEQLIRHRHRFDKLLTRETSAPFVRCGREFTLHVFRSVIDGRGHFAFTLGDVSGAPAPAPLVRVQRQNLLEDIFRDTPGGSSLDRAFARIAEEGSGAILYITVPTAGVEVRRGPAGDVSLETPSLDDRDIGVGAHILADLGLRHIRLLTNSPRRVVGLEGYGLEVDSQVTF